MVMKLGMILLAASCLGCGAKSDLLAGEDDAARAPGSPNPGPQLTPPACPIQEPGQLLLGRVVETPFLETARANLASNANSELFMLLKMGRSDTLDGTGYNPRPRQLLKLDFGGRSAWSSSAGDEPLTYTWNGALAVAPDGSPRAISPSSEQGPSRPTLLRFNRQGTQASKTPLTKNSGTWAPLSVGIDETGATVLLGLADSAVDVGGGALATAEREFFVAKLDPSAQHLWSHAFGGPVSQVDLDVAPDGTITLAGELEGTVVFGDMIFESASKAPFVAALGPDGSPLFSKLFQSPQPVTLHDVARDPAGNSYVALSFSEALELGSATLTASHDRSLALVKLGEAGELAWGKVAGSVDSLSLDGSKLDELLVTGAFRSPIDLGAGPLTTRDFGIFVANLTGEGHSRWLSEIPGSLDPFHFLLDVAWGPCESVAVGGCFSGSFDTGADTLVSASRMNAVTGSDPNTPPTWHTTWYPSPLLLLFGR